MPLTAEAGKKFRRCAGGQPVMATIADGSRRGALLEIAIWCDPCRTAQQFELVKFYLGDRGEQRMQVVCTVCGRAMALEKVADGDFLEVSKLHNRGTMR